MTEAGDREDDSEGLRACRRRRSGVARRWRSRSAADHRQRRKGAVRSADRQDCEPAPGKDTVSIIEIHDPIKPRILANLPLMNTIIGPPVNLAITPDQHLALVANSLDWVKDGESWKGVPDDKI